MSYRLCLHVDFTQISLSGFAEEFKVVWRLSVDRQNTRRKNLHIIHVPIVCFLSYVFLIGIQNVSRNGSCLWKSKCKRASYWKSRVYIYFSQDKIKGAFVVGSINHVTSMTNSFSKIISSPTSTIFVSGTSESVSYFLEFFFISRPFKEYRSVNPINLIINVIVRIVRMKLNSRS